MSITTDKNKLIIKNEIFTQSQIEKLSSNIDNIEYKQNCTFQTNIDLSNLKADLKIENSIFSKTSLPIEIVGDFENKLVLDNIDLDNNYLNFTSTLNQGLYFHTAKNVKDITFGNSIGYIKNKNNLYIQDIDLINIQGDFNSQILFQDFHTYRIGINGIKANILEFQGLNCKTCFGNFTEQESNKDSSLTIVNSQVSKIYLINNEFAKIYFDEVEIQDFYNFHKPMDLYIQSIIIGSKLLISQTRENDTEFINLDINIFHLYNTIFKKDSKLHFKSLIINDFAISNITQEWTEAIFEDVKVTGTLKLENINLKNAIFVDCDFSECEIEIKNSVSFKDTLFNSVKWGDDFSEPRFKAKRDIFRQLKFSNDSQGNIIEANNFYSEEMRRYEKEKKSKGDTILFYINKIISDFSQSWIRVILWIILLLEIHYSAWCCINKNCFIYCLGNECKMLEMLSPLNNFVKELPVKKILTEGIEFLSMIFYAIYITLIYHLTIALRRQTKR